MRIYSVAQGSLMEIGPHLFKMSMTTVLLVPVNSRIDASDVIEVDESYLDSCIETVEGHPLLCGTPQPSKSTCLKDALNGKINVECASQVVALDKAVPHIFTRDHQNLQSSVYIPPYYRLRLTCPGSTNYTSQTWEWVNYDMQGLKSIRAPYEYCGLMVEPQENSEFSQAITEYFIPHQHLRVNHPNQVITRRQLLGLLNILDRSNLNVSVELPEFETVKDLLRTSEISLKHLQELASRQPWDHIDFRKSSHKLVASSALAGIILLLFLITGYFCCRHYRASRAQGHLTRQIRLQRDLESTAQAARLLTSPRSSVRNARVV